MKISCMVLFAAFCLVSINEASPISELLKYDDDKLALADLINDFDGDKRSMWEGSSTDLLEDNAEDVGDDEESEILPIDDRSFLVVLPRHHNRRNVKSSTNLVNSLNKALLKQQLRKTLLKQKSQ